FPTGPSSPSFSSRSTLVSVRTPGSGSSRRRPWLTEGELGMTHSRWYLAAAVLIGFSLFGIRGNSTVAPPAYWLSVFVLATAVLFWPGIRRWLRRVTDQMTMPDGT